MNGWNEIVNEAGKIIGESWEDFGSVYTDLLIKKASPRYSMMLVHVI